MVLFAWTHPDTKLFANKPDGRGESSPEAHVLAECVVVIEEKTCFAGFPSLASWRGSDAIPKLNIWKTNTIYSPS